MFSKSAMLASATGDIFATDTILPAHRKIQIDIMFKETIAEMEISRGVLQDWWLGLLALQY